ncbi:MAG: hypothetical protein R3Y49_07020 [Rikenellaceae bacterium]
MNKFRFLALLFSCAVLFGCTEEDPVIEPETPETPEEPAVPDTPDEPETPEEPSATTAQISLCNTLGTPVKGLANDGAAVLQIAISSSNPATQITITAEQEWGLLSMNADGSDGDISIEDTDPTLSAEVYTYYLCSSEELLETLTTGAIAELNFTANITTEVDELSLPFTVEVVRSALVLAHGLASNAATFTPTLNYITPMGLFIDEALYALNYQNTSLASYNTNLNVIPDAIDHTKEAMLLAGYINEKVTIAGHSMGGILTRLYLQGETYRNDILKFISIDSPHSGSQLADFAVEIADYHPDCPLAIVGKFGAIIDLQVDSDATLNELNGENLNKEVVATHLLTATFSNTLDILNLITEEQYFEAIVTFVLDKISRELLYHEDNDIVVPLSSQQGGIKNGLTKSYITNYDGVWHCTVYTTQDAANDIVELCNTLSTDSKTFTMDGFEPPVLSYTRSELLAGFTQSSLSVSQMAASSAYQGKMAIHLDADGDIVGVDYVEGSDALELSLSDEIFSTRIMGYDATENTFYYVSE